MPATAKIPQKHRRGFRLLTKPASATVSESTTKQTTKNDRKDSPTTKEGATIASASTPSLKRPRSSSMSSKDSDLKMNASKRNRHHKTNTTPADKQDPSAGSKAHYPAIHFDPSLLLKGGGDIKRAEPSSSRGGRRSGCEVRRSQRELVVCLLDSVCQSERSGLVEYFSHEVYASKDEVLAPMERVLEFLPQAAQATLEESYGEDSIVFLPEVPSRESADCSSLRSELESMEAELAMLRRYGRDVDSLEAVTGVCGTSMSTMSKSHSSDSSGDEGSSMTLAQEDAYRGHLGHMNTIIDSIMTSLDDMWAMMSEAKEAQERLYEAFSKVRFGDPSRPIASVATQNPRDILRVLQKM